jgi:hypothetical protein
MLECPKRLCAEEAAELCPKGFDIMTQTAHDAFTYAMSIKCSG